MRLYLMRHAIAVPHGAPGYPRDAQRPLTDEGRQQATCAAQGLRRLGILFDAIATSPYVRAVQTATQVARVYGWRQPFEEWEMLQPDADPQQTSLALKALKEREHVLLVGHEPHLSAWLGLLIGGPHLPASGDRRGQAGGARCQMKKASVACVEIAHAPPIAGSGELRWLLTSKQLALIGT